MPKMYRVEQVNGDTGVARMSQDVPEKLIEAERNKIRNRTQKIAKFASDYVRVTEA